jgi:hypothetical protein
VWEPVLKQGPVEVQVFGDFNRDKALDALRRTFGALPARGDLPAGTLPPTVQQAAPNPGVTVLRHEGDPVRRPPSSVGPRAAAPRCCANRASSMCWGRCLPCA